MESSKNETSSTTGNDNVSTSSGENAELVSSKNNENAKEETPVSSVSPTDGNITEYLYSIQQNTESINNRVVFVTDTMLPLSIAILLIVIGCAWFYKTFIKKAL